MNVLMISGDKNILDEKSVAYARFALQKSQVDRLDAFSYRGLFSGPRGGIEVLWAALVRHYDVVTVQEPFWRGLLGWMAATLAGAKLNIQLHAELAGQSLAKRVLARFVLARADTIRVVSERAKSEIEAFGVHALVRVLPIFVDVTKFSSVSRRPHEGLNIVWFGRYEQEKDPFTAISVLEDVLKAGIKATLIMLGEGSMREEIIKRANDRPIIQVLTWSNPLNYFDTADVVLSTSTHESWGASIVEALAAGIPVVAPDVGVAREAGAIVVPREKLSGAVIEVLKTHLSGELKLQMPTAEEWAKRWKESLI